MNAYTIAVRHGFPYIRGSGKPDRTGKVWLSRFTKTSDGSGPALYVGFRGKRTIIERGNPRRRRNPEGQHHAPVHHAKSGGGMGTVLIIGAVGIGAVLFLRGGSLFGTGQLGPGGMPVFTPGNLPPGTILGTPGAVPPIGYRQVGVTTTGQPVYAPSSGVGSILSLPGIASIGGGIVTAIGGALGRIFGGGGSPADTSSGGGGGGSIGTADILRPAPGEVPSQSVGTVSTADINRPVDVSTWIDPSSGDVAIGATPPDPNMVPVDLSGSTWFDPTTGELLVQLEAPGGNFVPWDLPPGGYDTVGSIPTDVGNGGDWVSGIEDWWGAIA